MAEQQLIPARHGTATFVPAGQTIKIINTSGSQVIDTWAFALPKPEPKKGSEQQKSGHEGEEAKKGDSKQDTSKSTPAQSKKDAAQSKKEGMDLPSQEDAEKATEQGMKGGEEATKDAKGATPQKNTWGSYVPSFSKFPSIRKQGDQSAQEKAEQQQNSRTWASYFPSGKGFSNYVPQAATDSVSTFANYVCIAPTAFMKQSLTNMTAPTRSQQILHGAAAGVFEDASWSSRLER